MNSAAVYGLVSDVGGTHARFALVELRKGGSPLQLARPAKPALLNIQTLRCRDYPDFVDAVRAYCSKLGIQQQSIRAASIAVAAPIENEKFKMTNNNWSFSRPGLQESLKLEHGFLINDYTAIALAVPCLHKDDYRDVGGGSGNHFFPVGIIGPGTGLGVGGFVHCDTRIIPLQTEGGHTGFAPTDEIELQIMQILLRRFKRVSNERLLSGPGLVNLYHALAELRQQPAANLTSADITDAALHQGDELCMETLNRFCSILGSVAGDLALTLGAKGGIYIAGGIVPRFIDFLQASQFRQRFEDKGRFRSYNAMIPTRVVTTEQPGLLGAAVHLLMQGD